MQNSQIQKKRKENCKCCKWDKMYRVQNCPEKKWDKMYRVQNCPNNKKEVKKICQQMKNTYLHMKTTLKR